MSREKSPMSALLRCVINECQADVHLILVQQLGGTVGDIESAPFVEAMRQFQFRVGASNFALVHVSLVPDMHGEQKTKPTQTTIHCLRGLGLMPDLVSILRLPPRIGNLTTYRSHAACSALHHCIPTQKTRSRCSVMSHLPKSLAYTMSRACIMYLYSYVLRE